MLYIVAIAGMVVCAVFAVRATHLLSAALWLAGVSVLTAIVLYLIGAYLMAVIELSLSVGLITILLVFAISMVGANSPDQPVSRLPNIPLIITMLVLVIGLTLPFLTPQTSTPEATFATIFWDLREADVLAQIALIFAGVLGVLGLLAEPRSHGRDNGQAETQLSVDEKEARNAVPLPDDEPEPELEML